MGLNSDHIGPNRTKWGRTHPLLPVAVLQLLLVGVLPARAQPQAEQRPPPLLRHGHEVVGEAGERLDGACGDGGGHAGRGPPTPPKPASPSTSGGWGSGPRRPLTDLEVGVGGQGLVHQAVAPGVARLQVHDVALGALVGQGHRGELHWGGKTGDVGGLVGMRRGGGDAGDSRCRCRAR